MSPETYTTSPTPFPAPSKTLSRTIAQHPTTASTLYFADKIVITVTQDGRLAHWVRLLSSPLPLHLLYFPLPSPLSIPQLPN